MKIFAENFIIITAVVEADRGSQAADRIGGLFISLHLTGRLENSVFHQILKGGQPHGTFKAPAAFAFTDMYTFGNIV